MKHKPLSLLLVLLFLSSQAPLTFAQQASSNDWTVVKQLKTNARLVVKRNDGKEIKGEMIEASDTTLTIDRDGKPFSIPRNEVRQVQVIEGKASKGKWALIGAGIGAAAGTGLGALKYDPNKDDYAIYIYMGTFIGTGVGAVSGLLFGQTKRSRTMVYDAR
jgi:hypothetical protein